MKTDITEIIAEFLSEVHSHSLTPYYKPHADVAFFKSLPEVAATKDDVDKTFFREMAKELRQRIRKNEPTGQP